MNFFSVWPKKLCKGTLPIHSLLIYLLVGTNSKVSIAHLQATPTSAHLCTQLPLITCNQPSIYSPVPPSLCLPDWFLPGWNFLLPLVVLLMISAFCPWLRFQPSHSWFPFAREDWWPGYCPCPPRLVWSSVRAAVVLLPTSNLPRPNNLPACLSAEGEASLIFCAAIAIKFKS